MNDFLVGIVARSFGLAVRNRRRAAGLTQAALAVRSGVDRSYLSGVEHGDRNPTLRTVIALADALGIPLSALFADTQS